MKNVRVGTFFLLRQGKDNDINCILATQIATAILLVYLLTT